LGVVFVSLAVAVVVDAVTTDLWSCRVNLGVGVITVVRVETSVSAGILRPTKAFGRSGSGPVAVPIPVIVVWLAVGRTLWVRTSVAVVVYTITAFDGTRIHLVIGVIAVPIQCGRVRPLASAKATKISA
jgi:hypothetical protein